MDGTETLDETASAKRRPWQRKKRWQLSIILCVLIAIAIGLAWVSRKDIADDFILQELEAMGLEATYDIVEIGPERQVLRNILVGDADRPDLTIEELRIDTTLALLSADLGRITLVKPRLYASYRDGSLSFGKLDPLIFTDSDEPFALPAYDMVIEDGRASLESDYGDLGVKLDGAGLLNDGFAGKLAVNAPKLSVEGCSIAEATIYGNLTTQNGAPGFDGPVRLGELDCPQYDLAFRQLNLGAQIALAADLTTLDAKSSLALARLDTIGIASKRVTGNVNLAWNSPDEDGERLSNIKYDLSAQNVGGQEWNLSNLEAQGGLRIRGAFERSELDAQLEAINFAAGEGAGAMLAEIEAQSEGTLLAPLAAKLQRGLGDLERSNRLSGRITAKQTGSILTGVIPEARLRNQSGQSAIALSQMQFTSGGIGGTRLSGNFVTSGRDLPRITGRMEQRGGDYLAMRVAMPEFRERNSSLSIPQLYLRQNRSGAIELSGALQASGPIPGGNVLGLTVPIEGRWSQSAGLLMWERCQELSYRNLDISGLDLSNQKLRLCPKAGRAILVSNENGTQIGARLNRLNLAGSLGGTPFKLDSGLFDLNWPGISRIDALSVTLGDAAAPNRFALAELTVETADDFRGSFNGADVRLDAVPMDITQGDGEWAFDDGVIALSDASFRVLDRNEEGLERFEPLFARGANMTIDGNQIAADAMLRNPASDRVIADVDIAHNLSNSSGNALISVNNLRFDDQLQPDQLTYLADGVIELADGEVQGTGTIYWSDDAIDSSGVFSTDSFDFAAEFGPVRGLDATIEFVDLINLTSAPNQTIQIASVDPGIEALAGVITYELRDGQVFDLKGGKWPFMGGTLLMKPVVLDFSKSEERAYTFEMIGLDAASFIAQMEISNLSATGSFDGSVPIIFDTEGNGRIENCTLVARAPGGNVAYVGELTYEDTGFIANFTFNMLKSLDYSGMRIDIEGPLAGILETKVEIDGVQQGKGASRNILTRELAKLPVKLNVNVNAPFQEMISVLRPVYLSEEFDVEKFRALEDAAKNRPQIQPNQTASEGAIQLEESEDLP